MIFCLQADAEEAEVEEVTRPRDSVLVRLGDVERDVRGWDVSHIRHCGSHLQGWTMCIWGPVGLLDCYAMHYFS